MKKIAILTVSVLSILPVVNCNKNTPIEEPPPEEPEYYDDIGTMWQLTDLPGDETNPSWSPDGTKIAFQYLYGGFREIYILDLKSGDINQLTDNAGANPCWSPDGTLILYDGYYGIGSTSYAVFTISVEGGEPNLITTGIEDDYNCSYAADPCWFPLMDRIAFAGNTWDYLYRDSLSLYLLDIPDGEPILFKHCDYFRFYKTPTVSPDGLLLACGFLQKDDSLGQEYYFGLKVFDINSGDIYFEDEADWPSPSWSPDSNEIAYRDEPNIYHDDIFIYSFSDGKKRRVTDVSINGLVYAATPDWSPDGSKIVFYTPNNEFNNYDYNLWIVELNDR